MATLSSRLAAASESAATALALAPGRLTRAVVTASAATAARGHLPVAGLNVDTGTCLLARLRQVDGDDVSGAWLDALLLAQVASDAIVERLAAARRAHAFWTAALADGAHGARLLARCGPVIAATAAADVAARQVARWQGVAPPPARAPTARIEARVTTLARLRADLADALGRLHAVSGAGALWLGDDEGEPPAERGVDDAALAARASAAADAAAAAVVSAIGDAAAALDAAAAAVADDGGATEGTSLAPPAGLSPLAAAAVTLGVPLPAHPHTTTPRSLADALTTARTAAAAAPPLPPLPASLASPSRAARAWLPLTAAALAAAAATRFLVAHSRLAGSSDLDDWIASAREAVTGSFEAHVAAPLAGLRRELVATLRDRPAPAVDAGAAAADRAALDRMLASFNQDAGVPAPVDPWGPLTAAYEKQLRSPLKALAAGDLARCLLIQVQQLRVGTAGALAELDQILKANELTLAVAGALPALALLFVGGRAAARALAPAAPDPRVEAAPTRLAFASVEAALALLARHPGDAVAAGELAADLDAALAALTALFARRRHGAAAEAAPLRSDVVALAAPLSPAVRAAAAARAARSYAVLRP